MEGVRRRSTRLRSNRRRRILSEESVTFSHDDDVIIVLPEENPIPEALKDEVIGDSTEIEKKRCRLEKDESVYDDISSCSICFDPYTNSGSHRIVCLKCGHLFGESCIQKWIRSTRPGRCPQCKHNARIGDVRRIFAPVVQAVDSTEIEQIKRINKEILDENEILRLELAKVKQQLEEAKEIAIKAKDENGILSNDKAMETEAKLSFFNLKPRNHVFLSAEAGSRYIDQSGEFLVITSRTTRDIFFPYGLRLIKTDGTIAVAIPIHKGRPRCCSVSPYDKNMVLSVGEDKVLCITRIRTTTAPICIERIELPASGWSCCWIAESIAVVGLVNGRILRFDLRDLSAQIDYTNGEGNRPIIYLHSPPLLMSVFAISAKRCIYYRGMQEHVLLADNGTMNSATFNDETNCFMVTFAPDEYHSTTYKLYKLKMDETSIKAELISVYESRSINLTRITHSCLWNTQNGLLSVLFNETRSQLVMKDWSGKRPEVFRKLDAPIIVIKEVATDDPNKFLIVCLSDTKIFFLDLYC